MAGHARFVCIVRHGLDTALSLRDLCDANEIYIREIHAYVVRNPRPAAWLRPALGGRHGQALFDLVGAPLVRSAATRYEDLVAQPQPTLDRLAAFLDLEPGSLAARRSLRTRPPASATGRPTASRASKHRASGAGARLDAATLALVAPIVDPVLTRAGYEPVSAGPAPDPDQAMRRYEITMGLQAKRSRAPDNGRS